MKRIPRAVGLTAMLLGVVFLGSCDLFERVTGNDPLTNVIRNNPADPGKYQLMDTDLYPPDGATIGNTTPVLQWGALDGVASYGVQVSASDDFASPLHTDVSGITATTYHLTPVLSYNETYRWRIRPTFSDGTIGIWSECWSFRVVRLTHDDDGARIRSECGHPESERTMLSTRGGQGPSRFRQ